MDNGNIASYADWHCDMKQTLCAMAPGPGTSCSSGGSTLFNRRPSHMRLGPNRNAPSQPRRLCAANSSLLHLALSKASDTPLHLLHLNGQSKRCCWQTPAVTQSCTQPTAPPTQAAHVHAVGVQTPGGIRCRLHRGQTCMNKARTHTTCVLRVSDQ